MYLSDNPVNKSFFEPNSGFKGQNNLDRRKKQAGIGLPSTVFLIVVVALIVVAMSDLNEASSLGFGQDFQSTRAFYAAESGAQVALNRVFVGGLNNEIATCNAPIAAINFGNDDGLNNCSATLSCQAVSVASEGADYFTFTSVGTCGSGFTQASRQVQVRAQLD